MIKAKHSWWAQAVIKIYVHSLVRKNFSGICLVNDPPLLDHSEGLVLCPNHMSWWDGILVYFLNNRTFRRKFFSMMLEVQLKRYWFFRKAGAFSIAPGKSRSVRETAKYTQAVIDSPRSMCVIFPQGELQPYSSSGSVLQPGLKLFLSGLKRETWVVPLAIKIQFEREPKPKVYIRFGGKHPAGKVVADQQDFNMDFHHNLQELDKAALSMIWVKDILS